MTLTEYLAVSGITLEQFAKDSGVSLATLKRIKQTGTASSTKVVARIVAVCKGEVTAADLVRVPTPKKSKRSAA
jgi:hypothetical protein